MFRAFLAVALAGSVSAQLSAGCKNALVAITTNPEASSCLGLGSLVPLLGLKNASTSVTNTSLTASLDSWLDAMCSASPCSNKTMSAVARNITVGCASDSTISSALLENIRNAQFIYPTLRKVMCLKDNGKNCITKTLSEIQPNAANISLSDSSIGSIIANAGSLLQTMKPLNSSTRAVQFGRRFSNEARRRSTRVETELVVRGIPPNVTCTNCIKAAIEIIDTDFPGSLQQSLPGIANVCSINLTQPGIVQSVGKDPNARSSSAAVANRTSILVLLLILPVTAFASMLV